jgi:predicted nucleic acid-binding protein
MEVEAMNAAMELYENKDDAKFLAFCKEKGLEVVVTHDKDGVKTYRVHNVVDVTIHRKPGKAVAVSMIIVGN